MYYTEWIPRKRERSAIQDGGGLLLGSIDQSRLMKKGLNFLGAHAWIEK